MWIDAIPEDPYAPCPCGCGMKWKFAKQEAEKHEKKFIENLTNKNNNDKLSEIERIRQ